MEHGYSRKKQRPPLGPLATTMGDLRHAGASLRSVDLTGAANGHKRCFLCGLAALGRLDGCSERPQTLLPVCCLAFYFQDARMKWQNQDLNQNL